MMWVMLVPLYGLALLPLASTGHLPKDEVLRVALAGAGLVAASLASRDARRLPAGAVPVILSCAIAFVLTQFDATAVALVTPGWFFWLSMALVVCLFGALVSGWRRGHGQVLRPVEGIVVASIAVVACLAQFSGPEGASASGAWAAPVRIALLIPVYLSVTIGMRAGLLGAEVKGWNAAPRILLAFGVGLGLATVFGAARLVKAEFAHTSGLSHLEAGATEAALGELRTAAENSNWSSQPILISLAAAEAAAGRQQEALRVLGLAEALGISSEVEQIRIARVFAQLNRIDAATSRLQRMEETPPVRWELLNLFLQSHNNEAARAVLGRSGPNEVIDLPADSLRIFASGLLTHMGRQAEARHQLELVDPQTQSTPSWLLAMARWQLEAGRADSACLFAQSVVQREPGDREGRRVLAVALGAAGETSSALAIYRGLIAIDSTDIVALDRAMVLAAKTRNIEATAWRELIKRRLAEQLGDIRWPRGGEMPWNLFVDVPVVLASGDWHIGIDAMGTPANQEYPRLNISLLDSRSGQRQKLGTFHITGGWTTYALAVHVERAGAYELRAHYDNDGVRYGPDGSVAEDRNAYVGTVSIE